MPKSNDTTFFQSSNPRIQRGILMAKRLQESGQQPQGTEVIGGYAVEQSPMAGLARALSTGLGGYMEGKAYQSEIDRQEAKRKAVEAAMDAYTRSQSGGQTQLESGETINWNKPSLDTSGNMYAKMLMANEDTADLGLNVQMGQMQANQAAAREMQQFKDMMPLQLEMAREKAKIERQYAAPSSVPSAIAIANEIKTARANGDFQRVNDLLLSAKMLDKGIVLNADGTAENISGYPDVLGIQKYAEQTGKNTSDLLYAPQIEQEKAKASKVGSEEGEATAKLQAMESQLPRLEQVANKLSNLGKIATYTMAGQARDFVKREAGLKVGDPAVARREYISTVDNEVLPLLRQTFGSQFTQKEGESLKITLGDPNKSPEEKDAVLRSFIQQKAAQIESLQRQVGGGITQTQQPSLGTIADGPNGSIILTPNGWEPYNGP